MFKRILVPLDGSRLAERAIPLAVRLARASDGTIIFLRAIRAPVEYESALLTMPTWAPAADPQERDEAALYLATIDSSDSLVGVAAELHVSAGPAAPLIRATAQARRADLIIMTHRGVGFSRRMLGSVAHEVVRTAGTPVLVLRDAADLMGPEDAAFTTAPAHPVSVAVALDGSPLAEAALRPAMQLAAALSGPERATLHLLRVVDLTRSPGVLPFTAGIPEAIERLSVAREIETHEAEEYLTSLAARLRTRERGDPDVAVTWSVAHGPDVASAIIRESGAREGANGAGAVAGCDLIALATHGRGGLRRWLMGSVTESVLQRTQLPVLTVRPQRVGMSGDILADTADRATTAST